MLWIKDPKTGAKSVTLTLFVIGFLVAVFKLFTSDRWGYPPFTGIEFSAVVGALGVIYAGRKHSDGKE